MPAGDIRRGFFIRVVMKDYSQFYGIVLSKPLRDRIILQTRYGQLEIPLQDINTVFDYGTDGAMRSDVVTLGKRTADIVEKQKLETLVTRPKLDCSSTIVTRRKEVFIGNRYDFDDSAHVLITTEWGELYFTYPEILTIVNYSCNNDKRTDFATTKYPPFVDAPVEKPAPVEETPEAPLPPVIDPKASQGFITPNGIAMGRGSFFVADYLIGGLQLNYGPTNWLSLNAGGLYVPLLSSITVGTGGVKITPLATDHWDVSFGVQGMFSQVVKTTHLGLGYAVVTYGDWQSHLSLFGGVTINHTDSLGYVNTKNDQIIIVEGAERIGKDVKVGAEFFFISNFDIVPLLVSIRYFSRKFTLDVGVIFSLYKAGALQTTKTIGEYVFSVHDFPIVPMISASYHF